MRSVLRARVRPRHDGGAAAVEFALLLPIFVLLAFGTISAGILFWHNLTITQAARDAARYGTTVPITVVTPAPAGEENIGQWLQEVHDLAKTQAWGSNTVDITAPESGAGYICVAYVRSAAGDAANTGLPTTSMHSGVVRGYNANNAEKCFVDNRSDARVQVLVRRDGELNAIFVAKQWELATKSDIPYERTAP